MFDDDDDGHLSVRELSEIVTELGDSLTSSELKQMVRQAKLVTCITRTIKLCPLNRDLCDNINRLAKIFRPGQQLKMYVFLVIQFLLFPLALLRYIFGAVRSL